MKQYWTAWKRTWESNMDRVTLEDKLKELEYHHKTLDKTIERGYTNYLGDASLGKMKQEKLTIKRSIEHIRAQLGL